MIYLSKMQESHENVKDRRLICLGELREMGYKIEVIAWNWHFRINDSLDVWIPNAKWHDIKTQKRGSWRGKNLKEAIIKYFTHHHSSKPK